MTTFTWTIANLEYNNDSDKGVVVAHYRVTAQDGDYTASSYGTQSFTPDPSADGYVAFADLTEATVIGWVKNALDTDAMEASLQDNIDAQKTPATLSWMPWVIEEV